MKLKNAPPDEHEWNFIPVPEEELPWCVLWEYARSSPGNWVEDAVNAWFDLKLSNGSSVSEFLTKHGGRFSLGLRHLLREIENLAPASLKRHVPFYELVSRLPEFPKAWTLLDPGRRKRTADYLLQQEKSRRSPWPLVSEPTTATEWVQEKMRYLRPDPNLNALLNQFRKEHAGQIGPPVSLYILAIDWTKYLNEDTVAEFKSWLKSESDRQRKKRVGREGRGSSDNELLRYLVAWRFQKAGLTYVVAQKELTKLSGKLEGKCLCLPITSDKSRWSKDIAAARENANAFFPKPDGG